MLAQVDSGWAAKWIAAPAQFTLKLGSGFHYLIRPVRYSVLPIVS